ncbi:MAG: nucleoside triphosphate pyrophosphohydrolase [Sphingobium sp.]|uniref:nucleoside triphosphate pyrophosphohydrolase n=1 Tax=Sphingobium sp. TaxID=1912891 RepID=UPI0029AF9D14|nr:nucleoside triphosphate pyrophosphohydrolase [Sphingobium sp.]MDX3910533.1 nucleoside triphosphate pyrophosphohydrolase [Sphingobium sp.]
MSDFAAVDASPADIMPLAIIMATLRHPVNGCPWDLDQTFATIAPYTIEEAYEVADAIARNDISAIKDELGDLLLQVVFHARIAEELGYFSLQSVVETICEKMIRRHPHVFEKSQALDDDVRSNWESIKAAERAEKDSDTSALAGVALALPALLRAVKIQKRAARTGFDWPDISDVYAKVHEEIEEVASASSNDEQEDEIGDLLFSVVNLARHLKVDPEAALRRASGKFEKRFRAMEAGGGGKFTDLPLSAKEELWNAAKKATQPAP